MPYIAVKYVKTFQVCFGKPLVSSMTQSIVSFDVIGIVKAECILELHGHYFDRIDSVLSQLLWQKCQNLKKVTFTITKHDRPIRQIINFEIRE